MSGFQLPGAGQSLAAASVPSPGPRRRPGAPSAALDADAVVIARVRAA